MVNFDHIVLRVSNFEQAIKFYKTLFSFIKWEEVPDPGEDKSLGFKHENRFTIWITENASLQTGNDLGWLDHYAFYFNSRDEVLAGYEFCKTSEWEILSEPKAYPAYGNFFGFSFSAPDNLKIEFVTR